MGDQQGRPFFYKPHNLSGKINQAFSQRLWFDHFDSATQLKQTRARGISGWRGAHCPLNEMTGDEPFILDCICRL